MFISINFYKEIAGYKTVFKNRLYFNFCYFKCYFCLYFVVCIYFNFCYFKCYICLYFTFPSSHYSFFKVFCLSTSHFCLILYCVFLHVSVCLVYIFYCVFLYVIVCLVYVSYGKLVLVIDCGRCLLPFLIVHE